MSGRAARLEVRGPDGRPRQPAALESNRVSVGRITPVSRPDISLEPDPHQWVGRFHCLLEAEAGAWWVTDNATVNGTYVRSGRGEPERISGRHRLQDGDVILILGDVDPDGARYWELAFCDPFATRQAVTGRLEPAACVEYDWAQARIFRRQGSVRSEIQLPPKPHQLVRFMVSQSERNGWAPVACTHDELIRAVWGEESEWALGRGFTRENLRDLVAELRQRLEPDPARPCIIQAVKGLGYRLVTCPPARPTGA